MSDLPSEAIHHFIHVEHMAKQYDFIAIGDIVTDAFIRIKDATVHCGIDRQECEICMRFGDKIPYEAVTIVPAVGNSPNAAVAAKRLGLSAALLSDLGDDYFGAECLQALKKNNIATDFVRVHKGAKTNYHYVLWFEDERTILVKHEDFGYDGVPDMDAPRWVYLSSLGEASLMFHMRIFQFLNEHPDIKFAFQPGTFQMEFGKEKLRDLYRRADVFICNVQEAQRILQTTESDIKILLNQMHLVGPKIVLITDGPKGAYAFDGTKPGGTAEAEMWFMPPYPDPKPPFERTGAGDAFASTFVAALGLGKSVAEALRWAPVNAMSVVQQIGAQAGLLTRPELEKYLAAAPEDYKPKKI